MLNVFRYVAIAIMLLAFGELSYSLFGAVVAVLPGPQQAAVDGAAVDADAAADVPADTASAVDRLQEFLYKFLGAVSRPLNNFCFGAILFVLVRIAREQAHDLATG